MAAVAAGAAAYSGMELAMGMIHVYGMTSALQMLGISFGKGVNDTRKAVQYRYKIRRYRKNAANLLQEVITKDNFQKIITKYKKVAEVYNIPFTIHIGAAFAKLEEQGRPMKYVFNKIRKQKTIRKIIQKKSSEHTPEDVMNVFLALFEILQE